MRPRINHDTQKVYIDVYEAASRFGTALHTVAMLSKRWNNIPESNVLTFGTDEDHGFRFVVSLPETPAWDIPIRHGELHEEYAIVTKAEEGLYWVPPSKLSQLSSAGVAYLETGILGKYTFEWDIWDLHLKKIENRCG